MRYTKVIALAVFAVVASSWYFSQPAGQRPPVAQEAMGDSAAEAFAHRAGGKMITLRGTVTRLLTDDRDGSPHQRFVVRTASGQTVLISHNLDLAARLDGLQVGDSVDVYGEYEWNDQGGLMHWTHDDPDGQHPAGYIDWNGRRYQ